MSAGSGRRSRSADLYVRAKCRNWSGASRIRPDPGRFSQELPMRTRLPLLLILVSAAGLAALAQSKQTLLMNRLGPSQMTLYIANGDGSEIGRASCRERA